MPDAVKNSGKHRGRPSGPRAVLSVDDESRDAHRKTAEYKCGKWPSHRSPHVGRKLGEEDCQTV
jgi:hypothetical protein